jgi:uncharacterized protein YjbJ (UPF0337 family)
MSKLHRKAQGYTKQVVGQMIGDERLMSEGNEDVKRADEERVDRQLNDRTEPNHTETKQ